MIADTKASTVVVIEARDKPVKVRVGSLLWYESRLIHKGGIDAIGYDKGFRVRVYDFDVSKDQVGREIPLDRLNSFGYTVQAGQRLRMVILNSGPVWESATTIPDCLQIIQARRNIKKKFEVVDAYQQLELDYNELWTKTEEGQRKEIKKAMIRILRLSHPDKTQLHKDIATEYTTKVLAAYHILCDPKHKKEYDRHLKNQTFFSWHYWTQLYDDLMNASIEAKLQFFFNTCLIVGGVAVCIATAGAATVPAVIGWGALGGALAGAGAVAQKDLLKLENRAEGLSLGDYGKDLFLGAVAGGLTGAAGGAAQAAIVGYGTSAGAATTYLAGRLCAVGAIGGATGGATFGIVDEVVDNENWTVKSLAIAAGKGAVVGTAAGAVGGLCGGAVAGKFANEAGALAGATGKAAQPALNRLGQKVLIALAEGASSSAASSLASDVVTEGEHRLCDSGGNQLKQITIGNVVDGTGMAFGKGVISGVTGGGSASFAAVVAHGVGESKKVQKLKAKVTKAPKHDPPPAQSNGSDRLRFGTDAAEEMHRLRHDNVTDRRQFQSLGSIVEPIFATTGVDAVSTLAPAPADVLLSAGVLKTGDFVTLTSADRPLKAGDLVTWTSADDDVTEGQVGKISHYSESTGRFSVKFPKASWTFLSNELKVCVLKAGDFVTWTSANDDVIEGQVGMITGYIESTGKFSVKFPKGSYNFLSNQLKALNAGDFARWISADDDVTEGQVGKITGPDVLQFVMAKILELEALSEGITEEEMSSQQQKGSVEMRCCGWNQIMAMKMWVFFDLEGVQQKEVATHQNIVVIPAQASNIYVKFQNTLLNFVLKKYNRQTNDWIPHLRDQEEQFFYRQPPNRVYEIEGVFGQQRVSKVLDRYGQPVEW